MPALRANAMYEGKYPLVSALSRPVIVEHLVASARRHFADAVAHGCTGKGNDQVRFEVSSRVLAPDLEVMAPARVWGLTRADCIELADKWDIPIEATEGEAVLDRREHVGPRDRVRRAREPVVVAAGGAVHADRERKGRARGAARARRRVRERRAGVARRRADRPRRAHRDARRAVGELRLGSHRHGREPAGRHQEPRGLRVPGVARADPGPPGPRRRSRSSATSRGRSSGSRSGSRS